MQTLKKYDALDLRFKSNHGDFQQNINELYRVDESFLA